jgi:predicted ATPase/class 3 adenylate cyclase
VGTLTFLFTDIEGSTELLGRVGEDVYAQVLAGHHALIRSGLGAHGGEEVDTQGDAFFAVFSSPRGCVAAVAEMQQAIASRTWPAGEQVRVRMGVHTGEASKAGTGLVGLDVHRAARVAAVGHGGQVLLSESAAVLVRDWLPPGTALWDLGVHRLKDLGRPERIFQLRGAGLQADFPPLRSLGNPALANNLPAQLASFVGRERELSQVRALVGSCRLVTLTGAGGSGKTRLALQVAADLLDGSGDGVWLVELAAVSGEGAVVPVIAEALGVAGRGRPALEALVDALAPQNVLIVLDNCEHLIGGCAKTADAVLRRCPQVHLLATSREPLGIGGEMIYRVPPLSLPAADNGDFAAAQSCDAIALFAERAKQQGVGFAVDEETAPLVTSICRRLDGMPLAIELAAARLRSVSLAALRDRLDQRFRLLTGGSRTALPRQQTLRATVEWSHSLLSAVEQVLLRRLSVFAESFDLEATEAVAGFGDAEAFDVAGLLGSLVDKSLVVAEPAGSALRYRLLETIRQFAAERLTEAGPDEAVAIEAAHCGHFLAVAEAAAPHLTGSGQGAWFARLDADQANLRRAADHAARDPDGTGQVLRFCVALRHYWLARSREKEAAGLLLPVLERPEASANPGLFASALVTAALCAREAALGTASQLGERAVELAHRLGEDRVLIEALSALCASYHFAGQPERGFLPGQEAVERARRLGDDFLLGFSLLLWLLTSDLMDPALTGQLYTEAIAATERSGDQLRNYLLHNNASVYALRTGTLTAARAHLDQAAEAMQAIGEDSSHPAINRGWLLREENDTEGARLTFETALRISRHSGDRSGLAYACLGLACLAGDRGDWQRAAALHGAAQALIDQIAEPWQLLEARYRRDSLHKIRTSVGEEQFARAYAKGLALSLDQLRPGPGL